MKQAYSITAKELVACGRNAVPSELRSSSHLVYSSPATLAYNSPGAQGFGVKRAGLAVPESVMLLIAPACCGRNTTALGREHALAERFYYLLLDDTDVVTGRHLSRIPEAVREIMVSCPRKPRAVMLCVTCVDALLGTDMNRVCKLCSELAGVPVAPCYMYALTREGTLPPMISVRQSIYSLLQPAEKRPDACNILGYFSPLQEDCELRMLLQNMGFRHVHEISTCKNFDEFQEMSQANINLVLHPEARLAAEDMRRHLDITSIELPRLYQMDKIKNLYRILSQTLEVSCELEDCIAPAREAVKELQTRYPGLAFAVGEWANADPFELSLALVRYGFRVVEIYGTIGEGNFVFLRHLAELSPDTRVFSNLSPSMLFYHGPSGADVTVGRDAQTYNPDVPNVPWADENQPFGFSAVKNLFARILEAVE